MSNVATVPAGPSVLITMADRYGMTPQAFEQTLRATVVPGECTREQFAAFLLVAKEYRLNPILKEIYAFPAKGGGIQPIVSIDGWLKLGNEHAQMNGLEFDDQIAADGELVAITARIWRKDRDHPITVTEYMEECRRGTDPWKQWPRRMLRHKATIQVIRYAFGYSAIVDPDEAERMGIDAAGMSSGIGAPHVSQMRTITAPAAPARVTPASSSAAPAPRGPGRPRKSAASEGGAPEAPPHRETPPGAPAPSPASPAAVQTGTSADEDEIGRHKEDDNFDRKIPENDPAEELEAEAAPTVRVGELSQAAIRLLRDFGSALAGQNTPAGVMRTSSRFWADNELGDDDVSAFGVAASALVEAHRRRCMGDITIAEADQLVRKALQ